MPATSLSAFSVWSKQIVWSARRVRSGMSEWTVRSVPIALRAAIEDREANVRLAVIVLSELTARWETIATVDATVAADAIAFVAVAEVLPKGPAAAQVPALPTSASIATR